MSVIPRSLLGLLLGIALTIEAALIAGVGHGSYAPLAFAASIAALFPVVALVVGPMLWLVYFLLIPKLRTWRKSAAIFFVLLIHIGPGLEFAHDDRALLETNVGVLLLFAATFLVTLISLSFLTQDNNRLRNS
ncbi:MAG TPA: hypothetical protein VN951_00770 [Pyrinomonadaceae bacterium]|nr:hypothetical protein [Pyrinomonadaceae bacterium]